MTRKSERKGPALAMGLPGFSRLAGAIASQAIELKPALAMTPLGELAREDASALGRLRSALASGEDTTLTSEEAASVLAKIGSLSSALRDVAIRHDPSLSVAQEGADRDVARILGQGISPPDVGLLTEFEDLKETLRIADSLVDALPRCDKCHGVALWICYDAAGEKYETCDVHVSPRGSLDDDSNEPHAKRYASLLRGWLASRGASLHDLSLVTTVRARGKKRKTTAYKPITEDDK
jgi:hypothetical protein